MMLGIMIVLILAMLIGVMFANSTTKSVVLGNVSLPEGGAVNDSQGKSNLEIPNSTTKSVDAGSSSNVMNASYANEASKNISQSEDIRKLPDMMANSSQNTGSNDTVPVEGGAVNSSLTSGLNSNVDTETRTNTARRLLADSGSQGANEASENVQTATVENDEGLETEADSSFELFRGSDELADEYSYDYDDYVDENMWGDEDWIESQHETVEDYVDIDSHILSTPVSAPVLILFSDVKIYILNHISFVFA